MQILFVRAWLWSGLFPSFFSPSRSLAHPKALLLLVVLIPCVSLSLIHPCNPLAAFATTNNLPYLPTLTMVRSSGKIQRGWQQREVEQVRPWIPASWGLLFSLSRRVFSRIFAASRPRSGLCMSQRSIPLTLPLSSRFPLNNRVLKLKAMPSRLISISCFR